ncbi:alpha-methylacyl-CoA racemase [Allocatelliglobosispora scoriae]|uniref:Alpha-methylacyl-CoA racemase n=1 Tax=Allocatelliglobosispora scoriae TaxID=643052 RepID=A0A841C3U6_9ACTN|nr:CaiB/BaiF CoA-transferase family protein [Allocatelliglobosispora scoriae]MBB5873732.1 alpha-methylacyl-CoA racemase [Allocatelliglobosispora scoriae]
MSSNTGPLRGLRVVEIAGIGPGPFCGMFLADLGADVVRVDRPGGGITAVDYRLDLLNRGKRSITADLKDPAGVELVLRLAGRADVAFEGFRPGVAERLGVGPDECLARNPRLVYGRMTGWGQSGPRARTAGHDLTYLATTGVLHAIGRAGGPPQIPLNLVGDFAGGAMYLVAGLLAALWESRTSGQGQVVDAAIVDGTAHLTTMIWGLSAGGAWTDERGVNLLDGGAPFYDVYPTADGEHVAVAALEPAFFTRLLTGLGLPEEDHDQYDRERWPQLRARLGAAFLTGTRAHWTETFAGSDGCVAPVLPMSAAPDEEHLAARATYADRDGVRQPAPAPRFSRTPGSLSRPPAVPGEHTEEIITDWGL